MSHEPKPVGVGKYYLSEEGRKPLVQYGALMHAIRTNLHNYTPHELDGLVQLISPDHRSALQLLEYTPRMELHLYHRGATRDKALHFPPEFETLHTWVRNQRGVMVMPRSIEVFDKGLEKMLEAARILLAANPR